MTRQEAENNICENCIHYKTKENYRNKVCVMIDDNMSEHYMGYFMPPANFGCNRFETKGKNMNAKEFEKKFNCITTKVKGVEPEKLKANEVLLVIEGDVNDSDYIDEITTIDVNDLKDYIPLIKAIKEKKIVHSDEYITEEEKKYLKEIDPYGLYNDITPRGDYSSHNLKVAQFKFFDENGIAYNVSLN